MAETLHILKSRRSCRAYKPELIEESKLNAIIEAGTYAATGMGKQSPIIIAVTDKALRDKLSKMNAAVMGMDTDQMQHFCRSLTSIMILGAILLFILSGVWKRLNVYDAFIEGAKEGFQVAVSLIPYVVAILVAVGVFRASGGLVMLQEYTARAVEAMGLDSDWVGALPVALMKPLSGPGARGMMLQNFDQFGVDSFVGHLSSILQGCTDTTFYILAVYFGSVGIKKYRYSVKCGLTADFTGIIAAVFISYFFFR